MRSLLLLLILSLHVNANAHSKKSAVCEVFLGLLQKALKARVSTDEDLSRLQRSSAPENPISERNEDTLSFRNGFQKLIDRMRGGDWPNIQSRIPAVRARHEGREIQIQKARHLTKEVLSWIPRSVTIKGTPIRQFVASDGVAFVAVHENSAKMVVHHLDGSSPVVVTGDVPRTNQVATSTILNFYETWSGEVVLAWIDLSHVRMIDARTGADLLNLPLSEIQGLDDRFDIVYRAIPFESASGLKVAVLPSEEIDHQYWTKTLTGFVIDARSEKVEENIRLPGGYFYHFYLLEDGHLYALGHTATRSSRDAPVPIRCVDLTENRIIFDGEYDLKELLSLWPTLVLDENGKLQVILHGQGGPDSPYRYDYEKQTFVVYEDMRRLKDVSVFKDEKGKPYLMGIVPPRVGNAFLYTLPMDGSERAKRTPLSDDRKAIFTSVGTGTIRGNTLVTLVEGHREKQNYERLHFISLKDDAHVDVSVDLKPYYWRPPFFSDGRLLMFTGQPFTWQLNQIWGTEKW